MCLLHYRKVLHQLTKKQKIFKPFSCRVKMPAKELWNIAYRKVTNERKRRSHFSTIAYSVMNADKKLITEIISTENTPKNQQVYSNYLNKIKRFSTSVTISGKCNINKQPPENTNR